MFDVTTVHRNDSVAFFRRSVVNERSWNNAIPAIRLRDVCCLIPRKCHASHFQPERFISCHSQAEYFQ